MGMRNFNDGHVKAACGCPLCGSPIVRTRSFEHQTGIEPIFTMGNRIPVATRTHEPTIHIVWECSQGCVIEASGIDHGLALFGSSDEPKEPKPEPLTGESLRALSPMAERAKHALDELGEGIDHDSQGKGRSETEPG